MDILTESDMSGLFESVTEVSAATPYKINVGFAYRWKVWTEQILPSRLLTIQQEHSVEFIHRMMELLLADGSRLTNRAIFEKLDYLNDVVKEIGIVMEREIAIYVTEIDKIKLTGVE